MNQTTDDTSIIYLYALAVYLGSGKVSIDVKKDNFDQIAQDGELSMLAASDLAAAILNASQDGTATIDCSIVPDLLQLKGVDVDAFLSGGEVVDIARFLHHLNKVDAIRLKEGKTIAAGTKDPVAFTKSLETVVNAILAPASDATSACVARFQTVAMARYPAARDVVVETLNSWVPLLERERHGFQQSQKFHPVLPMSAAADAVYGIIDGIHVSLQSAVQFLLAEDQAAPVIDRASVQAMIGEIDPVIASVRAQLEALLFPLPTLTASLESWTSAPAGAPFSQIVADLDAWNPEAAGVIVDFLLYFLETRQAEFSIRDLGKKERTEQRKRVTDRLKLEFLAFLKASWPEEDAEFIESLPADEKSSAILPKVLKHSLDREERDLMGFSIEQGLDAGKEKVAEVKSTWETRVNGVSAWAAAIRPVLLDEFETVLTPVEESLPYQIQEITRFTGKMDFYFQETKSQEDKVLIRDEIRVVLKDIDELVGKFEADAGQLLGNTFLDLEQAGRVIAEFKAAFEEKIETLNKTMKRNDAFKMVNLVEEIKDFFEKRNEKINLIKNMILVDLKENVLMISRDASELNALLRDQKGFSIERGTFAPTEVAPESEATAVLDDAMVETIEEDEFTLKKRLSLIEARLNELETIRKSLDDQKDKLLFRLMKDEEKPKFLQQRRVGECIICYEPITTLDEDVVVCPHCGRLAHYLCIAYWLEKYQVCPVCQGALVSPEGSSPDDITGYGYDLFEQ
jgi:hypothetical protein